MKVFQVLNGSKNPASHGEENDLAVFETQEEAQDWIEYLKHIPVDDVFTIVLKELSENKGELQNALKNVLDIAWDWFPDELGEEFVEDLRLQLKNAEKLL